MTASMPFLFVPIFSWPTAPGGKLHTYQAGGTTPIVTYEADGSTPNANPVVLDSNGTAIVKLANATTAYHFVLKDSTDTTTLWDADNYQASYLLSSGSVDSSIITYDQTAAEIAASVTPVNYAYASGDLRRYGADPSGVADSTTAITNALNSNTTVFDGVSGGGTYLFSTITIPAGTTLKGQSRGATVFESATSGNAITINGWYVTLMDFKLLQTGAIQGYGVVSANQYWFVTERVWIQGFNYGMYVSESIYHSHYDLRVDGGNFGIYYWGATGAWNSAWFNNNNTFVNCRATSNATLSWYLKTVTTTLINCDISGPAVTGITITGDSTPSYAFGNVLINPYMESVTGTNVNVQYGKLEIIGGFCQGGSIGSPATTLIRADQTSEVVVRSLNGFSYYTNRFWATNSSSITYERIAPGIAGSSDTTDATSTIYNVAGENSGSFTGTLTGCTTAPTSTITWDRDGNRVTLYIPALMATSNTTACSITGMPAAITPSVNQPFVGVVMDNGGNFSGYCQITNTSIIGLSKDVNSSIFTGSGTKGVAAQTITYKLN